MVARPKKTYWRLLRLYFRRFRMVIWVLVLLILAGLIYLNQVGLPGIIKRPLLTNLRERGIELQFSRLRLSWLAGVVAENVRFGPAGAVSGPQVTASNVLVHLDRRALLSLRFNVESINLRRGHFVWALPASGEKPARDLVVEQIQTDLRFLPGDAWSLDNFKARFQGADLELLGSVSHASQLREWRLPGAKPKGPPRRAEDRIRDVLEVFDEVQFAAPPNLRLEIRGDARDLESFNVRLLVTAPDAQTPWGRFNAGRFSARLYPGETGDSPHVRILLDAAQAQTPWASATLLHVDLDGRYREGRTNLSRASANVTASYAHTKWASGTNVAAHVELAARDDHNEVMEARFTLKASGAESQWARATELSCQGEGIGSRTNYIPDSVKLHVQAKYAGSRWAEAEGLDVECAASRVPPAASVASDPAWAWWTNFHPYTAECQVQAARLGNNVNQARDVALAAKWHSPLLELSKVAATFPDGKLKTTASLNIASRALHSSVEANFDPLQVTNLLPRDASRWLSRFTWAGPPWVRGEIGLIVPSWTTPLTNWGPEVLPTLTLSGQFEVKTNGSYKGVTASGARSHFSYTNRCWRLPDLHVDRPEGQLEATHFANEITEDFYWKIASGLDVKEVLPFVEDDSAPVLELFTFSSPPRIEAEIWGRSRHAENTGIKANIWITNFTFRGESFSTLETRLEYTNKTLLALDTRLLKGTQHVSAESVFVDFERQLVFLTNGFGTVDSMVVARAIGDEVAKALAPYRFDLPPTLHASGVIPLHGEEGADLRVIVEGNSFHWLDFSIPEIAGNVHWSGTNLMLTKVSAKLYEGEASGYAEFAFSPGAPATYRFALTTTNTQLKPLIREVFLSTNNIEGSLSGSLVVTHGSTDDWRTWDGYGNLRLRDGLIWDIPVFGVLSPILNGLSPGLGNSRANSASCTFSMTNGVLHSSDMEMQASGMRLHYKGTADLHTRVNARVEAELLRDVSLVGPLVSAVFWPVTKLFEYRITGTLGDPKLDSVYLVPKLMLLPFQPFRILKGLVPGDNKAEPKNGRKESSPRTTE